MALSPMMAHFKQIKSQHNDCIIFYRLGDFYEMFFDDAIKASKILDLTLTGRDCGLEQRAPMCGVPYHAADMYISKLIAAGEKVAICEQLNEPNGKSLVERDVIRIVTPGTITNSELIDEKTNNFICSVYYHKDELAIAWADITTGEFFTENFEGDERFANLFNELVKISPAEIIANADAEDLIKESPLIKQNVLPKPSIYLSSSFDRGNAVLSLKQHFSVSSLEVFNLKEDDVSIKPAGALLNYLAETQKIILSNISNIKQKSNNEFMMLDFNSIRNLELVKTLRDGKRYGSLLWVLDKTRTSMGARKLQNLILFPLNDISKINYRLDAVESFYSNSIVRQSIADILGSIKDVERVSGSISNGGVTPRECIALANSLELIPTLKFQLSGFTCECITDIVAKFCDFSELVQLLKGAISSPNDESDGNNYKYIKYGYNKELDELRDLHYNSRSKIADIEARERQRTGIKNLRISYNRVFGYYIEVTNSFKDKVPYDYIRRQTLTNAERYVTEELKTIEEKIVSAEDKAQNLELFLYNQIKDRLYERIKDFQQTAEALSELDIIISFATIAKKNGYVRPQIVDSGESLEIIDGRHPVVEALSSQRFIENDTILDDNDNRTMIITGPNMAGKSTYMRQVALISLMAHMGSFVPAKFAKIPIIDRIFTRIGASDSLISDQSTFMVEMSEVANIVKNATSKSLLILDEIGRGTSTYDGLSIAWAVVEYITKTIKAKTMFATHYHELTELEGTLEGVKNYKITVKETPSGIVFLRKIVRGGANKSFGIEVAELAGVDRQITDRAKQILRSIGKKDAKKQVPELNTEDCATAKTEIEEEIAKIDLNNTSPMQALMFLENLKEKVENNEHN